jgi:hypothetical protein
MRIVKFILVLSMLLSIVGCQTPKPAELSPSANNTPQVEQTGPVSASPQAKADPTQAPSSAAQQTQAPEAQHGSPEPPVTGVEDEHGKLLFALAADLGRLDSYRLRHTWTFDWSGEGQSGKTEVLVEYVADPYAERVVITRDGQPLGQELIRQGDVTYILMPEGWRATKSTAALFPPESDPRLGMLPYVAGATAELVGEEELDGLRVRHYRYAQEDLFFGDYYTQTAQALADVWVADQYDLYIKATLRWEGLTPDMGEGGFALESRVTDINQPIAITPPEGVKPPEIPEDIVMMRDASDLALVEDLVYYQTRFAPSEVADYYKAMMPMRGWTLEFDSRDEEDRQAPSEELQPIAMSFRKENRVFNISMQPGDTTLVIFAVLAE